MGWNSIRFPSPLREGCPPGSEVLPFYSKGFFLSTFTNQHSFCRYQAARLPKIALLWEINTVIKILLIKVWISFSCIFKFNVCIMLLPSDSVNKKCQIELLHNVSCFCWHTDSVLHLQTEGVKMWVLAGTVFILGNLLVKSCQSVRV